MSSPIIAHLFSESEWEELKNFPLDKVEEKVSQLVAEKCYWKANAIMLFIVSQPVKISAFHLKVAESHYQDKKYDLAFEELLQVIHHQTERKQLMQELEDKSKKAHAYMQFNVC